jgi:hypothetical protein
MIPNPGFIDLDNLTHRILVTHWLLLPYSRRRPSILKVRKILYVIRLADVAQEIFPREQQTPQALGSYHKAEIEKWWPIIKAANIKGE